MRLGLVTCRPLPEPDVDEDLTLAAFRAAGIETELVEWHQGIPEGFDALVVRSTWDYYLTPKAFRDWIRNTRTPLWNPPDLMLWNIDKHYLLELERQGVPIVPTVFDVAHKWPKFVVKPTISAGSYNTRVFTDRAEGEAFAREIGDAMIQPYLASVEGEGERSIIWIDGEITHAIRKNPRFHDGEESVSPAYSPSDEERALANLAVSKAPERPLYARVDVMRDDDGRLCVSELELIEPSLFLTQNPPAVNRLVRFVQNNA
jgi:hypothetical protein